MKLQLQSKKFGTLDLVVQHFQKFDNRVVEARGYVKISGKSIFGRIDHVKALGARAFICNPTHNDFLGVPSDTDACFMLPDNWEEHLINQYLTRFSPERIRLEFYNGDTHHNIGFWSNGVQVGDVKIGETPSREVYLHDIAAAVERMWKKGSLPVNPQQEEKQAEFGNYVSALQFTMSQLQSLIPVIFASDFTAKEAKESAIRQAAKTGTRVLISKDLAPTEEVDPREAEESTWSDVLTWANPDGTITTEFSHHY